MVLELIAIIKLISLDMNQINVDVMWKTNNTLYILCFIYNLEIAFVLIAHFIFIYLPIIIIYSYQQPHKTSWVLIGILSGD